MYIYNDVYVINKKEAMKLKHNKTWEFFSLIFRLKKAYDPRYLRVEAGELHI